MKRTIYLLTCLIAFTLCIPGLVKAQKPGDDFTSHIKNAGFEGSQYELEPKGTRPGDGYINVPEDWEFSSNIPGWADVWAGETNDVNAPAYEGNQFFNCWAGEIREINLFQKIKLPAGAYELSAMMRLTNDDPNLIGNQRIYAKIEDRIVESEILSEKGVGREWEKLELVFSIYEKEDSVTIGALSSTNLGGSVGWFQLDDVRLTYYGDPEEASVNLLQIKMKNLYTEINELYTREWITSGGIKLIANADELFNEYKTSRDLDELNEVIDSLITIKTELSSCEELYFELYWLLEEESILANSATPYPGINEFRQAINVAIMYLGVSGQTPEADLVYSSDLKRGIVELEEAELTYRLTQSASAEAPADFTFMIQAPHFTKKRGNINNINDAIATGWETNNVGEGDYKTTNIAGLNCWNNWSMDFYTMDLFQDLIVPSGIYSVECETTTDGPVTDNHAYLKSTAASAVSPAATYWYNTEVEGGNPATDAKWEKLETGKVFVANDGKLRIGFASTSGRSGSSGWFCATNFILKYYGTDESGYDNALAQKIKEAQGMCDSLILGGEMAKLKSAIETGKDAVGKDISTIDAAFAVMNEAMDRVPLSYLALKLYKEESNHVLIDLDETLEYASSLDVVLSVADLHHEMINADTTTYLAADALREAIKSFATYIKVYDTAPTFMELTELYVEEAIETLRKALATQTEQIEGSVLYKEQLDKLTVQCRSAINALRTSLEPGEDTDFTFLIVNPDFEVESSDNRTLPHGWALTKNSTDAVGRGAHYSTDPENTYLDSWNTQGTLRYSARQTVYDLPNGTYRLSCVVRADGDGACVIAIPGDSIRATIPNFGEHAGNIFENAPEDSPIKQGNNGNGFGWNEIVLDDFVVWNNCFTILVTTDPVHTRQEWNGWWFSADEFRLTYLSRDWNVGIEEVNAGNQNPSLHAYAVNGYMVVEGEANFTITTLSGSTVSSHQQLAPGIYIVKAGSKTAKVAVH